MPDHDEHDSDDGTETNSDQIEIPDDLPTNPFGFYTDDADASETYCERHERDMLPHDPLIRWAGAVYTTIENASTYSCPQCLSEEAELMDSTPREAYDQTLLEQFVEWDHGNFDDDWFRYVGEVDDVLDDERGDST